MTTPTESNDVAAARQRQAFALLQKMHQERHNAVAKSRGGRSGSPSIAALVAGELRRRMLQDAADAMTSVKLAKAQGATATQTAAKAAIRTITGLQQQLADPALADYDLSDVDQLIQQALDGLARLAIDAPPPAKAEQPEQVQAPNLDLTPAPSASVGTPASPAAGTVAKSQRPRVINVPRSGLQIRAHSDGRLEFRPVKSK